MWFHLLFYELKERKKLDTYLDTEDDYQIQQEVVKKPEIAELQRPAKVSDELYTVESISKVRLKAIIDEVL